MHLFDDIQVDLLAQDDDVIFLQCDEEMAGRNWVKAWVAGETIHIRLQILGKAEVLDDEAPAHRVVHLTEALVQLAQRLQRPVRKQLYRATIRRPLEFVPHLKVLLEPLPHTDLRSRERLGHHIRVTSPGLPGYQATVRDISELGIGLDLSGPLTPGSCLTLQLEPDGGRDRPFELEAEVCWCRSSASFHQGRAVNEAGRAHAFEAGLRLRPLARQSERSLKAFLSSFASPDPGGD